MRITGNTIILIIVILIPLFGCQKSDLKKDGYFIYKANDKKNSFNTCLWLSDSYIQDSVTVNMNQIFANARKDQNNDALMNFGADYLYIVYDGTTGLFSTPSVSFEPGVFYIDFVHEGSGYSMFWSNGFSVPPSCNVQLQIDTYKLEEGIIEGSVSGTFYNRSSGEELEVTNCSFMGVRPE